MRRSVSSVVIDQNIRAVRIYPALETKRNIAELKTVGFKLTAEQARHLALALLAAASAWTEIDVTGWRSKRASDNTSQVTVTSWDGSEPDVEESATCT
jgi:hypothetical protein